MNRLAEAVDRFLEQHPTDADPVPVSDPRAARTPKLVEGSLPREIREQYAGGLWRPAT